jgi:hypothetical protein
MTKSLNETILNNLHAELNMAMAKRSVLVESRLATDNLDVRIKGLLSRIETQKILVADELLRAENGLL